MKEKLLAALLAHYPTLKPKTASKYVDKYINVDFHRILTHRFHPILTHPG